jgi:predicted PurR-regulated permease PerM
MDIPHSRHYFFLALLVAIGLLNALVFYPFLGALIFAATFTVMFRGWHEKFLSVFPTLPSLAAMLTIISISLAIIAPLFFFGILIFNEAQDVYIRATLGSDFAQEFNDALGGLVERYPLLQGIAGLANNFDEYLRAAASYLVNNLGAVFSGVATVTLAFFITLVALFFFLKDGELLRKSIIQLSPLQDGDDALIMGHLERVINSVIKGSLLIALIQGIFAGVGYLIFGVPNAALWGAATTLTALIPGIGTAVVIVPAMGYLFLIGKSSAAIGLLIWGVLVVGLIDNIFKPQLIASGAGIHPFLILLSVLGGLTVFGIYGFLLGPILLSFLSALIDLWKRGMAPHVHSAT